MPKTLLIVLLATLLSSAARADVEIVTTIKPLQLIAQAVVGEHGEVSSILAPEQSPHHFTMSPSDRIALARADMTLWIGPSFETFLSDFFGQANIKAKSITALALPQLRLHTLSDGQTDAHLWLDSDNAAIIAEAVMHRAAQLDPENADAFSSNLASLREELAESKARIAARLQAPSDRGYAVYHNAYQYFERQFGLQHGMVILRDPETQPSIRQIVALRADVKARQPACVLLEFDSSEELLRTVLDGFETTLVTVDLLGSEVSTNTGAYTEFLSNIADDFYRCLYQ